MHQLRLQRVRVTAAIAVRWWTRALGDPRPRRGGAIGALGLAFFLAACLDSSGPGEQVEGRAAHAIPGDEPALVLIDFQPHFQLQPLGDGYFLIEGTRHTYEFVYFADTLGVDVEHTHDVTAVILLDLGEPTVRDYGIDFVLANQRLAIINGQAAAGDLEVSVDVGGASFNVTLAPGAVEVIEPPAGSVAVRVRGQDDEDETVLAPFELTIGDHGFLVLVPGSTPGEPYAWMLF